MGFDQTINYKVNLDDSNFQARLSQLRSSMDAQLGGGFGGGVGYNPAAMMGMMGGGNGGSMAMGGIADFGSQIRPITYSAPAIAMTPHFGMAQIQQTLGQAGLGAMGPLGGGIYAAGQVAGGFMRGGVAGAFSAGGLVPGNISAAEYFNNSSRAFGDRAGDMAAVGIATAGSMTMQLGAMGLGGRIGASMFTAGSTMATVGGLLGGAALAAAPAAYVGAVMDVYGENRSFQETLAASSFRFISGAGKDVDPITGRGLSRRARVEGAGAIQAMEMSDNRFGAREYQQVLEGGAQLDLFSGSGDIEGFKTKFKGLVENLKTITATLHTSLKEGMEVIRGMRDIGVTDPGQINGIVLGSEVAGRVSGRTGMEMMAIGQQGAELFRGTGISMAKGFELAQSNTEFIRQGLNQGTITRETVAQAGGETALAQQLTAGTLASFQTTLGRGMMMAAFNPVTGSLDASRMLGGGDAMSLVARAGGLDAKGLLTLQAQQANLISKMSPDEMRMFDLNQTNAMARTLGAATGISGENAFRAAGQMLGKNEQQINADLAFIHQDPNNLREEREKAMQSVAQQAQIEDQRNRFWGVGKRVSNAIRASAFISGPAHLLESIQTSAAGSVESASQYLMGGTAIDTDALSTANAILGRTGRVESAGLRRAAGSTIPQRLLGTAGEDTASIFSGGSVGYNSALGVNTVTAGGATAFAFNSAEEADAWGKAHHMGVNELGSTNVIVGGKTAERFLVANRDEYHNAINNSRKQQITTSDREAADKEKIDQAMLDRFMGQGYAGKNRSLSATVSSMYGGKTGYADLTGQQKAYVQKFLTAAGPYGSTALGEATNADNRSAGLGSHAGNLRKGSADDLTATIGAIGKLGSHDGIGLFGSTKPEDSLVMLEAAYGTDADRARAVAMIARDSAHGGTPSQFQTDQATRKVQAQAKWASQHSEGKDLLNRGLADAQAAKDAGAMTSAGGTDKEGSAALGTMSIGDISKDTMQQIMDMSKVLEAQIKMLQEMQKNMVTTSLQHQSRS